VLWKYSSISVQQLWLRIILSWFCEQLHFRNDWLLFLLTQLLDINIGHNTRKFLSVQKGLFWVRFLYEHIILNGIPVSEPQKLNCEYLEFFHLWQQTFWVWKRADAEFQIWRLGFETSSWVLVFHGVKERLPTDLISSRITELWV
jgi:hypothetical protein